MLKNATRLNANQRRSQAHAETRWSAAKLALPFSFILFGTVTKWWFTIPTDAVDTMMWGFPLPFMCEGWHTSMSRQFFLLEGIFDFVFYYVLCLVLLHFLQGRRNLFIKQPILKRIIWGTAIIFLLLEGLLVYTSNSIFYISRPFEMRILDTGSVFLWESAQRPDITDFRKGEQL